MSDIGIFLLLFVGVLLLVGVIRFLAWLTELQNAHGSLGQAGVNTVKRYVSARPAVMSRSQNSDAGEALSSKDGQNAGRTDNDQIGRAELLTLYKTLRKYGVPREEIRPALKGVRVPLSNDVWASAAEQAPQEDANYRTPIVGRVTNAKFETDADFPYVAPTH
jgi:hypothetical protein